MKLGWVDFSKEDRNKALDVINLLQGEGAVDELGLGIIRDAFANHFFPGTSTIQTRAKYFLIVPYALKDTVKNWKGNNINDALQKLDDIEKECGLKMFQADDSEGVIGRRNLPHNWVSRTPSSIYLSGLRTYGILTDPSISISGFFKLYSINSNDRKTNKALLNKVDAQTDELDDVGAGDIDFLKLLNIPSYESDWIDNLKITLTAKEAKFLKSQIIKSVQNSIMGIILMNNLDIDIYTSFKDFSIGIESYLSEEEKYIIKLANQFNELAYAARVRYNVLVSQEENEEANTEWDKILLNTAMYSDLNINDMFFKLNLPLNKQNIRTRSFLRNVQNCIIQNRIGDLDAIIINRELQLKDRSRAKIGDGNSYSEWIGGRYLDYRFPDARTIIDDIYVGEKSV